MTLLTMLAQPATADDPGTAPVVLQAQHSTSSQARSNAVDEFINRPMLQQVPDPRVPSMIQLQRWTLEDPQVTPSASSPFAFNPSEDHGSTWTDFGMRRKVGFQDGLFPKRIKYDIGLTVSFSDRGARVRPSGPPKNLRQIVRGWCKDGLEAVPGLVASSIVSALED